MRVSSNQRRRIAAEAHQKAREERQAAVKEHARKERLVRRKVGHDVKLMTALACMQVIGATPPASLSQEKINTWEDHGYGKRRGRK